MNPESIIDPSNTAFTEKKKAAPFGATSQIYLLWFPSPEGEASGVRGEVTR